MHIATRATLLLLAAVLAGCAPAPAPAATPGPAATPAPTPTATPAPTATPGPTVPGVTVVAGPSASRFMTDTAHAFTVSFGSPAAWSPSPPALLPDGQPPVRFTLVPAECPRQGTADISTAGLSRQPDYWADALSATSPRITIQSWSSPIAQNAGCIGGLSAYPPLSLSWFPIAANARGATVSATSQGTAPDITGISVVAIYTSVDAEHPVLTVAESLASATASTTPALLDAAVERPLVSLPVTARDLPDGTTATRMAAELTGCGAVPAPGRTSLTVMAKVGDAAPVEIGECGSDGAMHSARTVFTLPDNPAAEVPLSFTSLGGTAADATIITIFEWRPQP
jgi:hypothetical protein